MFNGACEWIVDATCRLGSVQTYSMQMTEEVLRVRLVALRVHDDPLGALGRTVHSRPLHRIRPVGGLLVVLGLDGPLEHSFLLHHASLQVHQLLLELDAPLVPEARHSLVPIRYSFTRT